MDIPVGNIRFEQLKLHSHLIAVRVSKSSKVLGYVSYDPEETAWMWVHKDTISKGYQTPTAAMEDLTTRYMTEQLDLMAKKMGVFDDEKYTKGR